MPPNPSRHAPPSPCRCAPPSSLLPCAPHPRPPRASNLPSPPPAAQVTPPPPVFSGEQQQHPNAALLLVSLLPARDRARCSPWLSSSPVVDPMDIPCHDVDQDSGVVAINADARKRKLGLPEDEHIANLASAASAQGSEFAEKDALMENASLAVPKSNDHSERAFYKELVKVIEASDVILEVLDARDPLGTRCIDMEKMVRKADPTKRVVLLLNKIDLVPKESVEKWLSYLREELPTVAFKCNTQEQRTKLGWKSSKLDKTSNIPQSSDCLGAENLIKLLKNYSRSHELKLAITVGIVGLPNVGKSSLINSLKRSRVVNVGSTPGVTRSMQEVQLDRKVKLLDCPGVVMLRSASSGVSVALRNCKRVEKMEDVITPVKEILGLCPHEKLLSLYKMPSFTSVDDFLQKLATLRGKLKKGGIVDVEAAAKIVLHDCNEGKVPYYTLPPKRDVVEDANAVLITEDGSEFNVDEIYKAESSYISGLKSMEDFSHIEIPSNAPPEIDEEMLQDPPTQSEPVRDESMSDVNDREGSKAAASGSTQHDKLYTAEGILDPRKKKAEKKRRKGNKFSVLNDMDADYDFKVDYQMKDASPAEDEGEVEGEPKGEDDSKDAPAEMRVDDASCGKIAMQISRLCCYSCMMLAATNWNEFLYAVSCKLSEDRHNKWDAAYFLS